MANNMYRAYRMLPVAIFAGLETVSITLGFASACDSTARRLFGSSSCKTRRYQPFVAGRKRIAANGQVDE